MDGDLSEGNLQNVAMYDNSSSTNGAGSVAGGGVNSVSIMSSSQATGVGTAPTINSGPVRPNTLQHYNANVPASSFSAPNSVTSPGSMIILLSLFLILTLIIDITSNIGNFIIIVVT